MNTPSLRLKSKFAALFIGALSFAPAAWSADALITFGTGSNTAGKGKTAGPNAAVPTLVETKDSIQLNTPNWWSTLLQFENFTPIPLVNATPADSLTLTIKGAPSGTEPKLLVIVFNSSWQERAEYSFDLSTIKPDQFTTIKAATTLGKAAEKGSGLLTTGVGVLQMTTRGNDHLDWSLEIKSIGTTAVAPVAK